MAGDFTDLELEIRGAAVEEIAIVHFQRIASAKRRHIRRHEDGIVGIQIENLLDVLGVERVDELLILLPDIRRVLGGELFSLRLSAPGRGASATTAKTHSDLLIVILVRCGARSCPCPARLARRHAARNGERRARSSCVHPALKLVSAAGTAIIQYAACYNRRRVASLNIVVLYDRWEEPEEDTTHADKSPLTRTLDKKEVEDEVADALTKLGHHPTLHCLDGSIKSLHAVARMECDLVFNLAESFAGNDTADYCIAAYLELVNKRFTGSGSHGLLYGQEKANAKKILEFHGIHTPVFARSFRGRLDFSHDLEFPVIVKPAREDGSIGIEFNAVVNSIRELMERIDWLHANFDSPVLIEEYVEGREMYVGVLGNGTPLALPVVELDLSKLPEGTPRIAGAEVKWGQGTRAYRDTKSAIAEGPARRRSSPRCSRRRSRSFRRSNSATTPVSTCASAPMGVLP